MKTKKIITVVVDNGFNGEYKSYLEKLGELKIIKIKEFFNLIEKKRNELTFEFDNSDIKPYIISMKINDFIDTLNIDLILFTGGADVNPELYGEKLNPKTSINSIRDEEEKSLFDYCKNIPKLGICRGSQFLCVMHGGKLIQHVENHCISHDIHCKTFMESRYFTLNMTSSHHQMMFPYNLNPNDFELLAWSKKFRSNIYLNGKNEQIRIDNSFLEPEIVLFKKNGVNSLAIQGHPEWGNCADITKDHTLKLISKLLINNKHEKVSF